MYKIFVSVLLLVVAVNGATDLKTERNLRHVDVEADEQFSVDANTLMQNATTLLKKQPIVTNPPPNVDVEVNEQFSVDLNPFVDSASPVTFTMTVTPYQPSSIALVDGVLSGSIASSCTLSVSVVVTDEDGVEAPIPSFKIHSDVHAEGGLPVKPITAFSFKVTEQSPHGRIDCSEVYLLDKDGNEVSYTPTASKYTAQTPSALNDHVKSPGLIWQDSRSYNVGDIIMTLTANSGDFNGVDEVRMVFFRPKYGPTFDILDQDGVKVGVSNNNPLLSEETRANLDAMIADGMYQSTTFNFKF